MTHTLKTTALAAAVILGTVSSGFAMDFNSATAAELKSMGYSDEVVSQLSSTELNIIDATLHGGSDSDARQGVASLIFNYTK